VATLLDSSAGEVASNFACHITKLVESLLRSSLSLCQVLSWSPCSGCRLLRFEVRVGGFELFLRVGIELGQAADLKLVQFNTICVRSLVKADGDKLNDDLLGKVEYSAHKYRHYDFVHDVFP
jgi:hypothetical protein